MLINLNNINFLKSQALAVEIPIKRLLNNHFILEKLSFQRTNKLPGTPQTHFEQEYKSLFRTWINY